MADFAFRKAVAPATSTSPRTADAVPQEQDELERLHSMVGNQVIQQELRHPGSVLEGFVARYELARASQLFAGSTGARTWPPVRWGALPISRRRVMIARSGATIADVANYAYGTVAAAQD